jgi:hypothetical protein
MGNLCCARIPNAVPKAQASPAFPQIRHDDKNAWPTQAGFSHTSAVPIGPNQIEQVYSLVWAPGPLNRKRPDAATACRGLSAHALWTFSSPESWTLATYP